MNISTKLKIMGASAITALVLVGSIGLYVANSIDDALTNTNEKTIPSIQVIGHLKSHQQVIALSVYRHIGTTQKEQMSEIEKTIDTAADGMKNALTQYEKYVRTPKGRELLDAEKAATSDYLTRLAPVIERSRANDKAGALEQTAAMAGIRASLVKTIDEHIALNDSVAEKAAEEAAISSRRGTIVASAIVVLASLLLGAISFQVIRSVNRSLNSIQKAISQIEGQLDFTVRAEVIGQDEIASVASSLNRLIDKLSDSLKTIAQGAHRISSSAAHLSTASNQVATASANQSESASSMAANIEQMTVSINHVGERSGEAHALSTESGKFAAEGETVIAKTVDDINQIAASVEQASSRLRELEASSEQISTIVAVIKEVAEQTNLLALNAAIEAARAGEQGRGFAVVADEVRKLAERTASSTTQIATMIDSIRVASREASAGMVRAVDQVTIGVSRAGDASEAIQRISNSSRNAVSMVEEIASAIREQGQASNAIAASVENIAQMSEESSAAASNSAESARSLDSLANEMQQIVDSYKL